MEAIMAEQVFIFDTTLRDGEQSPGASMQIEQKYEVALQLQRLGVDAIEAGFPVSSPHQFESCKLIAENVRDTTITALARALENDINIAAESIKNAANPRIHTFIATSPVHMKYKLNKDEDSVVDMAVKAVAHARKLAPEVEFSPEDATRSDLDFLLRIIEKTIDAGATIINIPDTVGFAEPEEFGAFIKAIHDGVSNMDKAIISVHCHNDLGLAVSNTIHAIKNGARQAEVTINGIGERAGNAALEELVMAFNVRSDRYPYTTSINTREIYKTSRLVSNIIGFPIPRNKAIVGDNAFSHESGIHQDGVLKHRSTYEIMTPEMVGREASSIVLGRHSGLHGFKKRLAELGFKLPEDELKKSYQRFLIIADKKKEIFDEDLLTIVSNELGTPNEAYILDYFEIHCKTDNDPKATIKLVQNGEAHEAASSGDGPVDAIFKAVDKCTKVESTLTQYIVHAVTPGKQALGEVTVNLLIDGREYKGRGSSTDILEASARAYINALNNQANSEKRSQ